MHIEFKLPSGSGGMAAGYKAMQLNREIREWAKKHNIWVKSYNGAAYRLCFEFGRPADYTLFALYWQPSSVWNEYTLVDD